MYTPRRQARSPTHNQIFPCDGPSRKVSEYAMYDNFTGLKISDDLMEDKNVMEESECRGEFNKSLGRVQETLTLNETAHPIRKAIAAEKASPRVQSPAYEADEDSRLDESMARCWYQKRTSHAIDKPVSKRRTVENLYQSVPYNRKQDYGTNPKPFSAVDPRHHDSRCEKRFCDASVHDNRYREPNVTRITLRPS